MRVAGAHVGQRPAHYCQFREEKNGERFKPDPVTIAPRRVCGKKEPQTRHSFFMLSLRRLCDLCDSAVNRRGKAHRRDAKNAEQAAENFKLRYHPPNQLPPELRAFQMNGSVPQVWPRCCGRNANRIIRPFPIETSASAILSLILSSPSSQPERRRFSFA